MSPVRRNRSRLILIGALAASLLVNALTAGVILRLYDIRAKLGGPTEHSLFFDPPLSMEMRRAILSHADDLRPTVQTIMQARTNVKEIGTTLPFDRDAVQAEMDILSENVNVLVRDIQEITLDTLEARAKRQ